MCKFIAVLVFVFSVTSVMAQFGVQFDNRGFEEWANFGSGSDTYEPIHWHSGKSASGSYSGFLKQQIDASTQTRPGSSGTKSAKLWPKSVLGVTANGNMTNGRMNAGSMSATGDGNYNYTQRSDDRFNTPVAEVPDSISVWVCFRSASATQNAQVRCVIHGDADFRFLANGSVDPSNMLVANASMSFQRTSLVGGDYVWRRLSIPFQQTGPCTDVRYVLFTITTNETPGQGGTSDDLYVDDVLLIYNPSIQTDVLAQTEYLPGETISVPFTLTGTMSPENLNANANQVIAQLSDASGSFAQPTELGRVTTNASGQITAQMPAVPSGSHYRVRVVSTNYPMVAPDNGADISVFSTCQIAVNYDPDQGTVTGSGNYQSGATCTLQATPAQGHHFESYNENGTVVSTDPVYSFTVAGDRNIEAVFAPCQYQITLAANPVAGGTVTGAGTYPFGTSACVCAIPNETYFFIHWEEDGEVVSTQSEYVFQVQDNRSLTALFSQQCYTVSVDYDTTQGCVLGTGNYVDGSTCTLLAEPAEGRHFVSLSENGEVLTTDTEYSFIVNGDRYFEADFAINQYEVALSICPADAGSVTGSGIYMHGETVTVSVVPMPPYVFEGWMESGSLVSKEPEYTFIIQGNRDLEAKLSNNFGNAETNVACLQAYPNPVHDAMTLTMERAGRVEVLDAQGRSVFQSQLPAGSHHLDVSHLRNGAYLLRLQTPSSTNVHRFVKF